MEFASLNEAAAKNIPKPRSNSGCIVLTRSGQRPDRSSRILLFCVHGLLGDPYGPKGTWNGLADLVLKDFPSVDVAFVSYKTGPRRWSWSAFTSSDFSTESRRLADELNLVASHYTAVFVLAHSMGGVVSLRMLSACSDSTSRKVRALIAFAVPFAGSTKVPWFATLFSPEARLLKAFSNYSTDAALEFKRKFKVVRGGARNRDQIAVYGIWGQRDTWVSEQSCRAQVPDENFRIVDNDHFGVCKPHIENLPARVALYDFLVKLVDVVYTPKVLVKNADFDLRSVKINECDVVNSLGSRFFGAESSGDEYTQAWVKRNSSVIQVIVDRSKSVMVGFFSVLPVRPKLYEDVLSGHAKPSDFGETDVLLPCEDEGCYYIGAIAADGRKAKAVAIAGVFQWLKERKRQLSTGSVRVLARAATGEGLKLVRRHKFRHVYGNDGVGGFFEGVV